MSGLTAEQIADMMKTILDREDERRRQADERIIGLKSIGEAINVSDDTVRNLARDHNLPLDWTPGIGYSIKRWELNRWLSAKTKAVEYNKKKRR